jgi:hypothetical protein
MVSLLQGGVKNYNSILVDSEDDDDEDEGSNRNASCVVLKMFIVGPKSLQECKLAFEPIAEPPTISHETIGTFLKL